MKEKLIIVLLMAISVSLLENKSKIIEKDKKLIKEYVEWDELRDNFKDYFNVILLKKTQEDESFKNLGELGILVTGFAGKFIEYTIDAYLNPEGFLYRYIMI